MHVGRDRLSPSTMPVFVLSSPSTGPATAVVRRVLTANSSPCAVICCGLQTSCCCVSAQNLVLVRLGSSRLSGTAEVTMRSIPGQEMKTLQSRICMTRSI